MSHTVSLQTQMNDTDALIKALVRMGYKRSQIEYHKDATAIHDYWGNPLFKKANVIIRKGNLRASNDLGWEQMPDGAIKAHLDDHFDQAWQNKLNAYYGIERSKIECDKKGLKYTEEKTSEGLQLRVKFEQPLQVGKGLRVHG